MYAASARTCPREELLAVVGQVMRRALSVADTRPRRVRDETRELLAHTSATRTTAHSGSTRILLAKVPTEPTASGLLRRTQRGRSERSRPFSTHQRAPCLKRDRSCAQERAERSGMVKLCPGGGWLVSDISLRRPLVTSHSSGCAGASHSPAPRAARHYEKRVTFLRLRAARFGLDARQSSP